MKVSREKKKEIRRALIRSAVTVFSEKGFRSATMREISTRAGYSAGTIYNYFPNKEKLLYGYFMEKQYDVQLQLADIPDFEAFSLKEKLQAQLECLLDMYLEDREFVAEAYRLIFNSPLRTFSEFAPIKKIYTENVESYLTAAIAADEIPEVPFPGFFVNLYWDYAGVILFYWLRDDSTGFTNTSVLIDLSLDIVVAVLQSNIMAKMVDMASFLFRSHLYGSIDNIHNIFSSVRDIHAKVMGDDVAPFSEGDPS